MIEKLSFNQLTPCELKKLFADVLEEKLKEFIPGKLEDDEYLTRTEAAKFLNIGKTKLYRLTKENILIPMQEGRSKFYLKSSLKEYRQSLLKSKNCGGGI